MKNLYIKRISEDIIYKCDSANSIALVSHTNPDGDAVGSGVALLYFLMERYPDKRIRFFVPNRYPEILNWVDPKNKVEVFCENPKEYGDFLRQAELLFILDLNQVARLENMAAAVNANTAAPRVLIDHHIDPDQFDVMLHTTKSSSTSFLIYMLIINWMDDGAISREIAQALYLGIMTDTGGFSFGNLSPELFRAVAILVEKGADAVEINRATYQNQSENRLRMIAYLIENKMVINHQKKGAYITLTAEEKLRFDHQIGDTEGVVNIPLQIEGIRFSALLIETQHGIKVSLRSVGKLDVNEIAGRYFNGGGHFNAAGGKLHGSIQEGIELLEKVIEEEL